MAEFSLGKKAGGVPVGVWVVGGTVVIGGIWFFIRNRQAKTAANTLATNAATTPSAPTSSGDFTNDNAEAIFADIRNLQGQETQFAGTASNLSNQLTTVGSDLSGQISKIPSGPAGPPGPAGNPGAQGNPGPPGPPVPAPVRPPSPSWHEAQVRTDGKRSLQFYASEYGTSMANILARTAQAESSDYYSPSSALHKYVTRGKWSNEVPAGYTLFIPYQR